MSKQLKEHLSKWDADVGLQPDGRICVWPVVDGFIQLDDELRTDFSLKELVERMLEIHERPVDLADLRKAQAIFGNCLSLINEKISKISTGR